jgi:hypothetical protein
MWYRIGIVLANIENRLKMVWRSVNLLYDHCLGIDHRKPGAYFVIGNNPRNLEYLIRISAFLSIRAMKYFRIQTVIKLYWVFWPASCVPKTSSTLTRVLTVSALHHRAFCYMGLSASFRYLVLLIWKGGLLFESFSVQRKKKRTEQDRQCTHNLNKMVNKISQTHLFIIVQ